MEPCSSIAQLNTNLPEDLVALDVYEWQEMDVNEFNNDNVHAETVISDANHNNLTSNFEPCDYNMNHCSVTDTSFCYHTTSYTDCLPDMSAQPSEAMLYDFHHSTYGSMEYCNNTGLQDRPFYDYNQNGSLGDPSSSPDSSLNNSYKSDHNSNYTLLQSHSWPPDEQISDDSVEYELTPFDDSSHTTTENYLCLNAYRMQQADVLPHFDKVFPPKHQKSSKRGRPVTYLRKKSINSPVYNRYNYSDSSDEEERYSSPSSPSKCKRGAKNVLLWKFLLEELRKSNGTHVQWVDKREGLFRFVDTTEVSKLWGQKKNKEDMNFEKLSRGIRYYYKEGLMARQEGSRLTYRFNWDQVPSEYKH